MAEEIRSRIEVCLEPNHLKRTVTITVLVGTWLTLYNQGDLLLSGETTSALAGKILLNYFTPFLVSNWGLISRDTDSDS